MFLSFSSDTSGHHGSPLVKETIPVYARGQTSSDTALTRLTSMVNSRLQARKKRPSFRPNKVVFYQVLEMYQQEVFIPIAKVIGLTPESSLRMALSMGILEIQNLANNTEKPFCGYSPADAFPTVCRQPPPENEIWSLREIACLTALYTEFRNLPLVGERIENVCDRLMYKRGYVVTTIRVRKMHGTPWVANADYGRLAHEFQERRVEAGRAVARRLEVNEEYGQLVEDVLFDTEELRLYGYTATTKNNIWEPRHISGHIEIEGLMKLVTLIREHSSYWQKIYWPDIAARLWDDGLYTVLKRFSVSPVPDCPLPHQDIESAEHAEMRERLMTCIMEAFQS